MNPLSYFYGFKGKELDDHTVDELRAIATRYQIPRRTRLRKDELVRSISRNLRYQKVLMQSQPLVGRLKQKEIRLEEVT